ncbi:acyl-CoA N-acyltransferase [Aspergillus ellipticus CBS 707.79]|uniref:Acyl-CoA N-acyltransferase n=1 Tax=Aspergillus ellipticus CBS 707.79 TaxID=1448320 RepID=A0A319E8L6_9EURO|nr:acyl-CoA N-acyltransferase [Aspergillus ellipticus CBS 707.79]
MSPDQQSPEYTIHPAHTPTHILTTRALITAYTNALPLDISYQNLATELASLPGKYSPEEGGIILLATANPPSPSPSPSSDPEPTALGCIALRTLPPYPIQTAEEKAKKICEIKRLYVVPSARKMGVGRALAEAVLRTATELGYEEVRLDSLREMRGPRRLYESLGFREVGAYHEVPEVGGLREETLFFGLKLD